MYYSPSTQGFYDQTMHSSIPVDAIEITRGEHTDLLAAQSIGKRITVDENGYPVAIDPPPLSLAKLKSLKIAEIEQAADAAIAPITSAYPIAERDTWPIQEAEAVAWTANSTAATPMLNAIATARGQNLTDVAANVLTKAAAFKALAGATFGKRKAKRDLIDAATTPAELSAITW